MALKGVEIPIAMEKSVAVGQAERRYEAVHHFADRLPLLPDAPEISHCCDGKLQAARMKQLKLQKLFLDEQEFALGSYSLQHLAEDQISETDSYLVSFAIKPVRFRIAGPAKIIHPHRGINDEHRGRLFFVAASPHFVQIPLPPNLATKAADPRLTAHFD